MKCADKAVVEFDSCFVDCSARISAARLNGARAPKSADWLKATPSRDTVLADNQFGTAFRFRFGLSPLPADQMPAACKFCDADLQAEPWHHLNCQHLIGTLATQRHNAVLHILARWIKNIGGFAPTVEPSKIGSDRKERTRPDLDAVIAGLRFISDVSIVNPLAATHLSSAQSMMGAAEKRAKSKAEKFADLNRFGKFFPMVVETTGGMHKDFAVAIKEIIRASRNAGLWAGRDVVHGIRASVAVAVQKGNASMVATGLHASRRRVE